MDENLWFEIQLQLSINNYRKSKISINHSNCSNKLMENLPNNIFGSMDDFLIPEDSKPLGSGSFGIVKKAIHKMTGKVYAVKIVQLNQNMNQPQMLLLSRQISIHYQLNHPHIIKLWAVLEQHDRIYLIMDYAQNGNLFNYLNKKKCIPEGDSYRIFYQVMDAIEYMHKFDVFHRDLKPENILLDHQYNVKLCDFGWVADDIHRKRTTFCGTYEYMAPEMVQEIPYNYKIDIWALGILLYELNHGKAPFPAESAAVIKEKFQKGIYEIKETLSQEFKNLIVGILQFDPSKRNEIEDIKKSNWVKKFKIQYMQNICSSLMRNLPSAKADAGQASQISNTIKAIKDDRSINDLKHKKYRKKYRTLEEEDLYCISQNLKMSKHASTKENQMAKTTDCKESQLRDHGIRDLQLKSSVFKPERQKQKEKQKERQRSKEKDKEKQKQREKQRRQQAKRKKMATGSRTHLRSGTETSELLHKKLSKIVFQQKLKLFQDDGKKKLGSKRT